MEEKTHPARQRLTAAVKAIGKILLVAVLIRVILTGYLDLFFCSENYARTDECGDFVFASGYYLGYHKLLHQNHAAVITFLPDAEDTGEIVIPETYQETSVCELGGYLGRGVPMPFGVDVSRRPEIEHLTMNTAADDRFVTDFDELEAGHFHYDEVIYDDYVLSIGKEIRSIFATPDVRMYRLRDGRTVAYCTRFYVICSEENRDFHAVDGILYDKKGNVFRDFIYVEQELPVPREAQ